MLNANLENDTPLYVSAAHFMHSDDRALFSALDESGRKVELVVIEDPENPLLQLHAEIRADEVASMMGDVEERFPGSKFAEAAGMMLLGEGARARLIDHELANLRATMNAPDMGVFAEKKKKSDVDEFIEAHIRQPSSQ